MWYQKAKNQTIFSISGWRAILTEATKPISIENNLLQCFYYGLKSYIEAKLNSTQLCIAIGCDTRKSGIVLMKLAEKVLFAYNCKIINLGMLPGPAIMAYTKSHTDGFIYFTASHNPPMYNGIKFGSHHGKTQSPEEHKKMMDIFLKYTESTKKQFDLDPIVKETILESSNLSDNILEINRNEDAYLQACKSYKSLVFESVFRGIPNITAIFKQKLLKFLSLQNINNLGILWDPNGGARTWSVDSKILSELGIKTHLINTTPSEYVHTITPEGEALTQASDELVRINQSQQETSYLLAVVSDCDGDRGNTIFSLINNSTYTRKLNPQEVFCVALKIELAWQQYIQKQLNIHKPIAIAINGPSSLRCELIAKAYNAKIFRGEVGEANVIATGERLLREGFDLALVGEASNGGTIMFPSTVRDPLCTILSLFKGILWSDEIGISTNGILDIMKIADQLPQGSTTDTENPLAKFPLPSQNNNKKNSSDSYLHTTRLIIANFDSKFYLFKKMFEKYGLQVQDYCIKNFVGEYTHTIKKEHSNSAQISSGGLAFYFYDTTYEKEEQTAVAYTWLRPSGTEPIVRIKADVLSKNNIDHASLETALLNMWIDYLKSSLGDPKSK